MSEGVVSYDVNNVRENPRMLSVAQKNNGNIHIGSFNNGGNTEEPVDIMSDVDNVGAAAAEVKNQGINANLVVPADGADAGELTRAENDAKNAGAETTNESRRFTKRDITEMRRKYLSEGTTTYAKKNFYNRRNG